MYSYILSEAKTLQLELDNCVGTLPRPEVHIQTPDASADMFNHFITDKALRKTVEKLYRDGHHARAVEEAYKFIDNLVKKTAKPRLNSDKVLFSIARGRERCDRNGHAVFLRPGVDFATTSSETTGISTSSTKLK